MDLRWRLQGRVRLTNHDRWFFVQLYRWFPSISSVLTIVRWHRTGFRCYWRWKSRSSGGRSQIDTEPRVLIRRISIENPLLAIRDHDGLWQRRHAPNALQGHPRQPTAPASPRRIGAAERSIGSIRRECLDHIIVFGETHPWRTSPPLRPSLDFRYRQGFTEGADSDLTDAELRAAGRHRSARQLPTYAKRTRKQLISGSKKRREERTKAAGLSE